MIEERGYSWVKRTDLETPILGNFQIDELGNISRFAQLGTNLNLSDDDFEIIWLQVEMADWLVHLYSSPSPPPL
jgi:hypothetical protein